MQKYFKVSALAVCIVLQTVVLSACGGGSSSPSNSGNSGPSNNNNPPVYDAPTVSMLSPANNSTGIPINPTPVIELQFSESVANVSTTTVTLHESSSNGNAVPLQFQGSPSENVYSFVPTSSLKASTTYYVEVSNQVTSVMGNLALSPTSFSFSTVLASRYAYITNFGSSNVSFCSINESHNLTNCTVTGSTLKNPYGIAIHPNDKYAYIANANNSITICSINQSNGNLTNCDVSSGANQLQSPYGLAVDPAGQNLYVANFGSKKLSKCSISTTDGSLSNCVAFVESMVSWPYDVAIHQNTLYVTNYDASSASLSACLLLESGGIGGCEQKVLDNGMTKLSAIALSPDGQFAFVGSLGSSISSLTCAITGPSFGGCVNSIPSATFNNIGGMALDSTGGYIYIVNSSVNSVSVCQINPSNGLYTNCVSNKDATLNAPEFIAIR